MRCLRSILLISVAVPAFVAGGCVSKSRAREQARMAFLAGQNTGLRQASAEGVAAAPVSGMERPQVLVNGNVRNPRVLWTPDLTLASVLVTAEYLGREGPSEIHILRRGLVYNVAPHRLLRGDDFVVEPGDEIELVP